jgi:hypothetical protein
MNKKSKLHSTNKSDKQDEIIIETSTDLFASLMDKAHHLLVKSYRKEISEFFFSDVSLKYNNRNSSTCPEEF